MTRLALALMLAAAPALADSCRTVDGDTLHCREAGKVRLLGIDAPELRSPQCREERRLAERARDRLAGLVAGVDIEVNREGRDRYGRTLATVRAGGIDLGAVLVAEGLARVWTGRREPWC